MSCEMPVSIDAYFRFPNTARLGAHCRIQRSKVSQVDHHSLRWPSVFEQGHDGQLVNAL